MWPLWRQNACVSGNRSRSGRAVSLVSRQMMTIISCKMIFSQRFCGGLSRMNFSALNYEASLLSFLQQNESAWRQCNREGEMLTSQLSISCAGAGTCDSCWPVPAG